MNEQRIAHLILNPVAGRGRSTAHQKDIETYLKGWGIEAAWHMTEEPGHAGQIASGLPDETLVVAVGGDGTVHEVAAACMETKRTMGVLPVGSGNDYVKALGIGTRLERALEVLVEGIVRRVDMGEVNGLLFNNGLGIGFDAEVAAGVKEAPKILGGAGGYLWSVGRLLWGFECHEARLKFGDGEEIAAETILVAVALGTTYGARFRLAPGSSLEDGAFDVVWSEEVTREEVIRLIPSVLRGTHLGHPKIHFGRTAEIEVVLKEATQAHIDGEILPPAQRFRARVLPRTLRVLAP